MQRGRYALRRRRNTDEEEIEEVVVVEQQQFVVDHEEVITVAESDDDETSSEDDNNQMVNTAQDVEMASPTPENSKAIEMASQTTPGLVKNGGPPLPLKLPEASKVDESFNEEQSCPICFEEWTSSGKHRLCSLTCGHLFGRSCIERWIKDTKKKCCPQCKMPCKSRDIRNIFAKGLKALDTSDRDQARKELLEEKYRRSRAEESEAKAVLQCQLLQAEMERLKRQVQQSAQQTATATSSTFLAAQESRQPLATLNNTQYVNTSLNTTQHRQQRKQSIQSTFIFQKAITVAQKEARVMCFDKNNVMVVVSKPSPNRLFKGFGVLKVSSLDSRCSEFISIHQNVIRDSKFNGSGDRLLLTASTDKTLKLTNMLSNSVVQSYTCPAAVWACAWNEHNTNYVYAGLQNGVCLVYDIRRTDQHLASVRPRIGYPIVTLDYVPPDSSEANTCEGVLVGHIQGGWFLNKSADDSYAEQQLIIPQGSYSGLHFEPTTRHCLLSQRPGKNSNRVIHSLCSVSCTEGSFQPTVLQQCMGGLKAQALTRAHLLPSPTQPDRLLVCAGDEATSKVHVWDGSLGTRLQELSVTGGTVFDILTFDAFESRFLATLTESKLSFFQWQS